ncbi:unnamed protein product, partial [Tetraodon nigroviridis]
RFSVPAGQVQTQPGDTAAAAAAAGQAEQRRVRQPGGRRPANQPAEGAVPPGDWFIQTLQRPQPVCGGERYARAAAHTHTEQRKIKG